MKVLDPQLLNSISDLKIIGKLIAQGLMSGTHISKFKGFNTEFAEYRQYHLSDGLKFVDWKLFARTDKMYVKQFIDETELNAIIAIDTSSSMEYKNKLRYAFYLASGLSYIFYKQNDYQKCILFNEKIETSTEFTKGVEGFSRTINIMENFSKSENKKIKTDLEGFIHYLMHNIEKRYILFLLTDLWVEEKELKKILNISSAKNEVYLLHILDEDELKLNIPEYSLLVDKEIGMKIKLDRDLIKRIYVKKVQAYIEKIKKLTSRGNIKYDLILTNQALDVNLRKLLEK